MKRIYALIGAILLLFALTACDAAQKPEDTAPSSEPITAPESAVTEINPPKEPMKAPEEEEEVLLYTFRLFNSTDHTVTALSFREAGEPAYTVNLLPEDLKDGESIALSYNAAPALRAFEEAQGDTDDADTPLMTPEFRLLVLLEDGSWHELAAFPLEDADEGTLLFEDGILYLSYESFSTGHLISTRDAQRWILSFGNAEAPDYSAMSRPGDTAPAEEAAPAEDSSAPEAPTAEEEEPDGKNDTGEAPQPEETGTAPEEGTAEEDEDYDPDAGCLTGGLFH